MLVKKSTHAHTGGCVPKIKPTKIHYGHSHILKNVRMSVI